MMLDRYRATRIHGHREPSKLQDTSGASIVIALVFFLICAIIGSVVVTAASVNAKTVQTHKELQQAEYSVGSAAQVVGHQLESAVITNAKGDSEGKPVIDRAKTLTAAVSFWDQHGADVVANHGTNTTFRAPVEILMPETGTISGMPNVYGTIEISPDLNIAVKLSLDKAATNYPNSSSAKNSPYNMTVYVQCVPTYDVKGALVSFAYEPAIITKGW